MKVSPRADYPVRVVPEPEEMAEPLAPLYQGIYRLVLNHVVDVVFVPDLSRLAPPWDPAGLPAPVENPEQARLETVLSARYAVTPNQPRAGTHERFTQPSTEGGGQTGVVFYTGAAEFDRFAEELSRLCEIAFGRSDGPAVTQLRAFEVIGFLEQRVVASGQLGPWDAMMLGQTSEDE